ncbi:T9SS type A sorting domain-containing protein [candidate division KSB1 bacterium]|nr:T9SS type A sorting domain-containing protein [candidate division KSB1 bacterium]
MRYLFYLLMIFCTFCSVVLSKPALYMSPAAQQVDVGTELNVAISLRDLPGGTPENVMKSFSIIVDFNPALLEVMSLTEGTFLTAFGSTWAWSEFDNIAGTAKFDDALLSTPFAYGSGTLFTIRFRAKASGTVSFVYNKEDLRDGTNYPLAYDTETGTVFSGDAHLYIDPDHTALGGPGEECTIAAKIRNGFNIRGIKIILTFDPTRVELVSVTNGSFMRPPGYNTFASHSIAEGKVEYNESILTPANVGVQGEGTMFSVRFRALANGFTPVVYKTMGGDYDKTQLTNVQNQYLDYTHEDGEIEIGPIVIELCTFTAHPLEESVMIEWTTAAEINSSGFFVHRAESENVFHRIHTDMILARGKESQGADYQFIDTHAVADNVRYKLEEICCDGSSQFYGPIALTSSTAANETNNPQDFFVISNYPNPFNPATTIRYYVPVPLDVHLKITDVQGHIIKTIHVGEQRDGHHELVWNGTNDNGDAVASGLYIYTLKMENKTAHGRMLLVK